ncbi:MAG: hypothetical protein AB4372_36150 [Xenococcus sp. (in: cyanobacteria)]
MTQKIQGKFYPLTNGITKILRQAKLTATEWRIWSYLVEIDPWGDRYENFDYLSVMSICDCSKSSFYRAIAKFQELKIFDFQARGLSLRNLTGVSHFEKSEPKAESDKTEADRTKTSSSSSKPKPKPKPKPKAEPEPETEQDLTDDCPTIHKNKPDAVVPEMGKQSQNWESSLKNEKVVPEMGNESQNWENEGLKPLSDIASSVAQTLQRELDPPVQPDGEGEDLNSQYEEVSQSEQVKPNDSTLTESEQVKVNNGALTESEQVKLESEVSQNESNKAKEEQKNKHATKAVVKEKVPRDVAQKKSSDIPIELVERLEELEIPLDEKVISAINSHHISQAYGAAAHVERTWETINNPRGVFLFQLPKQKIEQMGARLPEIGKQMREENAAIEEEMASDEYKAKSQEMFAKFRERFGKGGKKK